MPMFRTQSCFCHILLDRKQNKNSPDSKDGKTDYTYQWQELQCAIVNFNNVYRLP